MEINNCDCAWYHCTHWAVEHELQRARERLNALSSDEKKKIAEQLRDIIENPE